MDGNVLLKMLLLYLGDNHFQVPELFFQSPLGLVRSRTPTRFQNAIMELESKAELEPATPAPDGKLASGDASLAVMLESKDGAEKPVDASLAAVKLDQLEKLVAGVMSDNAQSQLEATTHFRKVRPDRSRAAA